MTGTYFFAPKARGWDIISGSLRDRRPVLLLLDYDGTVIPIKSRPDFAVLPSPTRKLIESVAAHPGIYLGFVTGRSLNDIWGKIKNENLFYLANHGFQIKVGKYNWVHPQAKRTAHLLSAVCRDLETILDQVDGFEIEDKLLTLSVHYRNMKNWPEARLKETVANTVQPHADKLRISGGKKVIEIRPKESWDKGEVILKIIKLLHFPEPPLVIYIGDDLTDEDVFRILKKDQIGIKVGKSAKTAAGYYLRNPQEVLKLLRLMDKTLSG